MLRLSQRLILSRFQPNAKRNFYNQKLKPLHGFCWVKMVKSAVTRSPDVKGSEFLGPVTLILVHLSCFELSPDYRFCFKRVFLWKCPLKTAALLHLMNNHVSTVHCAAAQGSINCGSRRHNVSSEHSFGLQSVFPNSLPQNHQAGV